MPFLSNKDTAQAHKALFWRSGDNKAVRKGDWKLVLNLKDNITALYYLKTDKSELNNLAEKQPTKVEELQKELENWEKGLIKPLWPSNAFYKNTIEGNKDRFTL